MERKMSAIQLVGATAAIVGVSAGGWLLTLAADTGFQHSVGVALLGLAAIIAAAGAAFYVGTLV